MYFIKTEAAEIACKGSQNVIRLGDDSASSSNL